MTGLLLASFLRRFQGRFDVFGFRGQLLSFLIFDVLLDGRFGDASNAFNIVRSCPERGKSASEICEL